MAIAHPRRLLPGVFACLLSAAPFVAPFAAPPRPDPLDPKASVPALRYESPLAPYRRMVDDKPVPWREANEAVARIGGWRAYAREAQRPAPAASAASAASQP